MNWIVAGIACSSGLVAAVTFGVVRMRAYWAPTTRSKDELANFSLARYEPMMRLLNDDDLEFLKSQRGYRPEIGDKLRRERIQIFRLYLTDLSADFRALHAEIRQLVADSDAQHADLVGTLFRQQLTFWRAMIAIEFRLTTGNLGFANADIRSLVAAMEQMRADLARIAAVPTLA
jgi:hypothetical protein